jgi:hypothetical protein
MTPLCPRTTPRLRHPTPGISLGAVVRPFVKFLGLILLIAPALGWSQVIADRTTLNSIIGASGKTVDFESFNISAGGATNVSGISVLDSTTIASGQGPNLVPAGVTFSFGSGNLQWNDAGYYGAPSREILSNVNNSIEISFSTAAKAFGVDVRAFNGYTETATITVYAADKTTVLSTIPSISLPTNGTAYFFGYQSASGIGKVVLSQTPNNWSPMIDNLTFSVIPEPPVQALLGGGMALLVLVRRRLRRG